MCLSNFPVVSMSVHGDIHVVIWLLVLAVICQLSWLADCQVDSVYTPRGGFNINI